MRVGRCSSTAYGISSKQLVAAMRDQMVWLCVLWRLCIQSVWISYAFPIQKSLSYLAEGEMECWFVPEYRVLSLKEVMSKRELRVVG